MRPVTRNLNRNVVKIGQRKHRYPRGQSIFAFHLEPAILWIQVFALVITFLSWKSLDDRDTLTENRVRCFIIHIKCKLSGKRKIWKENHNKWSFIRFFPYFVILFQASCLSYPSIDPFLLDAALKDNNCASVSSILVLYTGGTIGMRPIDGAYQPVPNYLVKSLVKIPTFNDPQ